MGSLDDARVQIPVIDISIANADASKQLLDAASRFGFVFVANNEAGIPPDLVAQLFSLSKDFFALPRHVKQEVSIASNKAGKNHGWLGQGVEKLDPGVQKRPDVKEAFNLGPPSRSTGQYDQPLPALLRQDIDTLRRFQVACADLCGRILRHFAMALGIDEDWFASRHDETKGPAGSVLRLLYYPRHDRDENDEADIRAGAHSDFGSITCLFQLPGQPGLEIQTPAGEWAPVPVDPLLEGADGEVSDRAGVDERVLPILVNIGDLLEDWTGGLLKSTKHRVVFPTSEHNDRYSIAYFCQPLDDALLEPVPSKLVQEHANVRGGLAGRDGKVMTAGDHLMERLSATYNIK